MNFLLTSVCWSVGLSYEEIPGLIQENNEIIQSFRKKEKAQKARLGHLNRSFIPEFETYAGQEEFNSDALGTHSSFFYGVSGTLNLYNGSRDKLEENKREEMLKISKNETLITKTDVVFTAQSLYLELASHKAIKNLYNEAISRVKNLAKEVKQKISAGVISNSDLTSLDLLKKQYIDQINEIEIGINLMLTKLSVLMGMDELNIADINSRVLDTSTPILKKNLKLLEYELEKTKKRIHQIQATKESRGSIPTVDFFADYGKLPFSEREISQSSDREEWRTGIKVSWDIGQIWESKSLKRQARASAQAAEKRQQYIKNKTARTYESLLREEGLLNDSISSLMRQVSMSRKYFSQIKDEYLRGVKSTSDLNSALNQLLELEKRRIEKQQQHKLTNAKLAKLTGDK